MVTGTFIVLGSLWAGWLNSSRGFTLSSFQQFSDPWCRGGTMLLMGCHWGCSAHKPILLVSNWGGFSAGARPQQGLSICPNVPVLLVQSVGIPISSGGRKRIDIDSLCLQLIIPIFSGKEQKWVKSEKLWNQSYYTQDLFNLFARSSDSFKEVTCWVFP